MASPVDADRAGTNISTASDPWAINYPGTIAAGDLLILYMRVASNNIVLGAGGGFGVTAINADTTDASDDVSFVYGKTADGSETGTVSFDMQASCKGAAIMWRITGTSEFIHSPTDNPEISSITTSTAANIDPATFTPSVPGGSNDYLWLSIIGMDSETATATNGTLSNVTSANSGTGGAAATNCRIWGGSLASTASSIDIGAWTSTAPSNGVSAWTLAVYPAAPATIVLNPGFVNFNDPGVL